MATVLFDTMVGEVATHVAGCPSVVISSYIRKVVTDLCERGKVWRVAATPVVLSASTLEYALSSSVANTDIASILRATIYRADTGKTSVLDPASVEQVFDIDPTWPTGSQTGVPAAYVNTGMGTVQMFPIPNSATTYTVNALLAVKPTLTATGWDGALFSEFRRAIFHGVLHELMMMPDRKWSDDKTAMYHGKQWGYLLFQAKAKANKGFGRASLAVRQRPWA